MGQIVEGWGVVNFSLLGSLAENISETLCRISTTPHQLVQIQHALRNESAIAPMLHAAESCRVGQA
jgi:hypothetical protein